MFNAYGEPDQSPFLIWLPISAGLLAAVIAAFAFCPLPRSQTISPAAALGLAVAYVTLALGVGISALAVCSTFAWRKARIATSRVVALFCSVAAWIAPMVAFYRRDSLWAAYTASVVAMLVAVLVYQHRFIAARTTFASTPEEPESLARRRPLWLKFAAVLLQFSALALLASMAGPAALLLAAAVFIVVWSYQEAISPRPIPSRYQKSSHSSVAVALAIVFVAASLTPYLAPQGEGERTEDSSASSRRLAKNTTTQSPAQKLDLLQFVKSLLLNADGEHPRQGRHHEHSDTPPAVAPYPVLQALFGEREATNESPSTRMEKKRKYRNSTALVTEEDSYPGMILRPPVEDHSPIIPPVARRTTFEDKPNNWKNDAVSIPFYGAYWFFRASDGTLPDDSIESRGDPASMSFKTTDFTPIAMEAHQSFGALIDLTCCKSLELVISNGDRRPATVAVELILSNTRLPGKPEQSLGICSVNSSQRWSADDNRPPATETLTFRVPAHPAIQKFDEATVRFQMGSPRERWSAKIAVLKFRLIPHDL